MNYDKINRKALLLWNDIVVAAQTTNGEDEKLNKTFDKYLSFLHSKLEEAYRDGVESERKRRRERDESLTEVPPHKRVFTGEYRF